MTITRASEEYQIRNYIDNDSEKIGMFDKVLELACRFHRDYEPVNIYCAVNRKGDILGVGHLEFHDTWNLIDKSNVSPNFIYKLLLRISINPGFPPSENLKRDMLWALITRAKSIRTQYPDKKIRIFSWVSSTDNQKMDFYLSQGFTAYRTSLVMKYDLTQDIPEVPKPAGIIIANNKMRTEDELKQFFEAESIAFSGEVRSLNHVRWMRGAPEWGSFSAFCGNQLVGNTLTWGITEERSATEDIFVLPEWRNKGVAKYMITEALKYLKSQGKMIATLGTYGDNRPAISLYQSLGYRMFDIRIEFGADL